MGISLHPECGDCGFQRRSGVIDGAGGGPLMENQPDAIHNPELREKLLSFEVDILRNDICDISLNLQLTERVIVSADGDVSSVEAVPEPDEPDEMWAVSRG